MPLRDTERDNLPHWNPGKSNFESYTLQGNDLARQAAVSLRFSLVASGRQEPQISLLGIFSEGQDPKNPRVLKETFPLGKTRIEREIFYLSFGDSALFQSGSRGELKNARDRMSWELKIHEPSMSFSPFPRWFYSLPVLRTKWLSPHFSCRLSGQWRFNDRSFSLESVPGYQNHHWGKERPVSWVWGHCNSFREEPLAAFEGITVRSITLLFFFYRGRSYSFVSPFDWFQNRGRYETCRWRFEAQSGDIRFLGDIITEPERMAGILHQNPDGGCRYGHQTGVADMRLEIFRKKRTWELAETLTAMRSAALEVGSPEKDRRVVFYG